MKSCRSDNDSPSGFTAVSVENDLKIAVGARANDRVAIVAERFAAVTAMHRVKAVRKMDAMVIAVLVVAMLVKGNDEALLIGTQNES